jgi:hypothetical protein
MSNWIDYTLEVLASNPAEMNAIAERLNQASLELTARLSRESGEPANEVANGLKELLEFKTITNLDHVHEDFNKARSFSLTVKSRSASVVMGHLIELSRGFPSAIFLLKYRDMQASFAGQRVLRAGEILRETSDGDQRAQAIDWVLIDIFAPFWTEYELGVECGSLWQEWLSDLAAAVQDLSR